MSTISDNDAKILHQRAVTAAGALVDAEIRHINGELGETYYRSFKVYLSIKQRLNIITAASSIEFLIAGNDKEIGTFLEAWKNCAPYTLEFALTAEHIKDHLHHGMVPVYAFDKQTYEPVGVILCIKQGIGLSFLVRGPFYVYLFNNSGDYKDALNSAAEEVMRVLEEYYPNE